jgi:carbon-monoxide dehydrogenase small subunit
MTFHLNGRDVEPAGVTDWESLLFTLRERLGLYGSKNACEQGECGSCSVFLDGQLVCSCLVLTIQAEGREVITVEGLADSATAEAVRTALVECDGVQCGFCTSGFVVAATELLERKADDPISDEEIREALSGNLCRCTGYTKIVEAVKEAALKRATAVDEAPPVDGGSAAMPATPDEMTDE